MNLQSETLDDWRITDVSRSQITFPAMDNDTGFLNFPMSEYSDIESIYWLAPDQYAGNLLQYYGARFEFTMDWVIVRGDTSGKTTNGPSLVLIARSGTRIAYGDDEFTDPNLTISIPMREEGWYHVPSNVRDISTRAPRTEYRGDPVTRMQLMAVLADVESVLLRGTFHADQFESVLMRATWARRAGEASLVEQCRCPPGYSGLSCESCDFGFVRAFDNATGHDAVGKCLQCLCNGHASTCDLGADECSECLHNTVGKRFESATRFIATCEFMRLNFRCEQCAAGHYGNAMYGTESDCRRCACPLAESSNNFSPVCELRESFIDFNEVANDGMFETNATSDYICTQCPEGHVGERCER